ncbi:MAG: EamA family transporter, partial [Rhodobacteraceae bacterium]|nr:EamA family transporter [Paracoccaceae bacterium]
MPAILKDIGKSVWENPHLVLALAALMWGGHTIVARASVGEVSPMLLMALRWLLCLLVLAVFLRREIKRDWPILRANMLWLMLMGGVGLAGFTIFFISAAQYTSAINLGIMQSSIPAFVILMSFLFLGKPFGLMQTFGLC